MKGNPAMTTRRYLIIPPEPTPNGGLHLGHIAGPFLRADVLARFVRSRGDHAFVITAVDSFEPWALQAARAAGLPLDAVIQPNVEKMIHDLLAIDIVLDEFVLPNEKSVFDALCAEADVLIQELLAAGRIVRAVEKSAVWADTDLNLIGPDLIGICPSCAAEVAGSACEACGGMWAQQDLLAPYSRNGEPIKWQEREVINVLLVESDQIVSHMNRLEIRTDLSQTISDVLRIRDGMLQATTTAELGLTATVIGSPQRLHLHSYFAGAVFARYAGKVYSERLGDEFPAFDIRSSTVLVNTLGKDNIVSTLCYVDAVQMGVTNGRPYDRVFVNEFYQLDGQKFSTSRGHLIRPSELTFDGDFQSDGLRLYLCLQDLNSPNQSFSLEDYERWHADQFLPLTAQLFEDQCSTMDAREAPPGFEEAWSGLELELDGQQIDLPRAAQRMIIWMQSIANSISSKNRSRLHAETALIVGAILPNLAQFLWKRADLVQPPTVESLRSSRLALSAEAQNEC